MADQDYDELIESVNRSSRRQRVYLAVIAFVGYCGALPNMSIIFTAGVPAHSCELWQQSPQILQNLSKSQLQFQSPYTFAAYGVYLNNTSEIGFGPGHELINMTSEDECIGYASYLNSSSKVTNCKRWRYDTTYYGRTLVNEWDLVCDSQWYQALVTSAYAMGLMIGAFVFGILSDRFGRKVVLIACVVCVHVIGVVLAFSQNIAMFILLRLCSGICGMGLYATGFVLGMELFSCRMRPVIGLLFPTFWAFGYMLLAGIAYFVRTWWILQLACTAASSIIIVTCFIIPESPRWLLCQGREKDARAILRKMLKGSDAKWEEGVQLVVKKQTKNSTSVLDLFRNKKMTLRTTILIYVWFTINLVYYGLSYGSASLGGDPYLNTFISGAVEVPAYLFSVWLIKWQGRKKPLICGMCLSGISLFASIPIPKDLVALSVTCAMVGKFAVTAAFGIVFIFTTELYPTVIRNTALGTHSAISKLSAIAAPFVITLVFTNRIIPLAIFGATSIAAAVSVLFLPETKGKKMPDDFETDGPTEEPPRWWQKLCFANISTLKGNAQMYWPCKLNIKTKE